MNNHEASRQTWKVPEGGATLERINAGSLQRIADATEKMAASYVDMERSRDRYKEWYEDSIEERRKMGRRIVALRGVITRLQRKLRKV